MKNTIAQYFDFCVSGEDDGVFPYRKPHYQIYHAAIQKYNQLMLKENKNQQQQQPFFGLPKEKKGNNNNDNSDKHSIGNGKNNDDTGTTIWFHVGDCLANDVGASTACGAKAIWLDHNNGKGFYLKKGRSSDNASSRPTKKEQRPSYSSATESDIEQRVKLANEAKRNVYATITQLSELTHIVENAILQVIP